MLNSLITGCIFGFTGYGLCKCIVGNHPDDKKFYYVIVPLFFLAGFLKNDHSSNDLLLL